MPLKPFTNYGFLGYMFILGKLFLQMLVRGMNIIAAQNVSIQHQYGTAFSGTGHFININKMFCKNESDLILENR